MFTMNPEVAALLEELAANTDVASVTFFPMGLHTHLKSDGMGGWDLEVHTTVMDHSVEEEQVISHEEHLTTDELVYRMSHLAMIAEVWLDAMVADSGIGDEVEAFLAGE